MTIDLSSPNETNGIDIVTLPRSNLDQVVAQTLIGGTNIEFWVLIRWLIRIIRR